MAFKSVFRSHITISNQILKYSTNNELKFVLNVRYLSVSVKTEQKIRKKTFPKNITLWRYSPHNPQSEGKGGKESRPLTLIFAWMFSKDKHLEKFRQLWFEKGFDVLTIQTSLKDSLLPTIGSQIVAKNVVKVLSDLNPEYNKIVIHAFSVGGYQCGEVLVQLTANKQYSHIMDSIKGLIMDSLVYADDCAPGVSRTVTNNRILQSIIESMTNLFLKLFHNIVITHYKNSEDKIVYPPAKYPGLILYSKNDLISSYDSNEHLVKSWRKLGNKIRAKCWDKSPHVLHYKHHQKEYEHELNAFVESLKL